MTNAQKDAKVSEKINAIRARAGNPMTSCPTCTRSASGPFRVRDASGKITHGCVDAFHHGKLVATSESNRWHNRPEAAKLRRAELARLNTYLQAAEEARLAG